MQIHRPNAPTSTSRPVVQAVVGAADRKLGPCCRARIAGVRCTAKYRVAATNESAACRPSTPDALARYSRRHAQSGGRALPGTRHALAEQHTRLCYDEVTHARSAAPLPRRMWAWTTQRFAIEHVGRAWACLSTAIRARGMAGTTVPASAGPWRDRPRRLAAAVRLTAACGSHGVLVLARIAFAAFAGHPASVIEFQATPAAGQ